ncbi:MAG: TRAP transporter large permease [Eubacterium sp.]|jgi:TRAP transporter, DctM subunit|nr:TRAP transporter large permease [Eubacterium sp.]
MTMHLVLFLVVAIVLLVIGVPVGITLGLSSILFFLLEGIPAMTVVQRLFSGCDVAALMCIPFFILAGDLMAKGGIAKRLVHVCNMAIGNVTGGLALVTIVVSAIFAAMTGSAMACCVTIGTIMLPYMLEAGYSKEFSTAIFSAGSVLGPIIPPSTAMIIYAVNTNVSLTDLYLMGVPAGIYFAVGLAIVAYFLCRKNGYKGKSRTDEGEKFTVKEFLKALGKAVPAIGSPLIILGSIYSGICTPTESAVLAVLYSLVIGLFVYKEIKIKDIPGILFNAAKGTANIMFIVAGASLFAFVISYAQLPQILVNALLGISSNKYVILIIILVILLIMGCIMDATPILLITIPMFLPVIQQLEISTLQFGIIMCSAVCIGFVTPPFGTCLFTGMSVSGVSMQKLVKSIMPFIASMLVVLLLITFIPQLTLWIAR